MKHIALLACGLTLLAAPQKKTDPEVSLQAAIQTETIDGDLNGAIKQYAAIVAKYKNDRAVTAMALVHMAECYQKLGDAESRKIYEQVVKEYADQKEAVAVAKARLGGNATPNNTRVVTRQVWTGPQIAIYAAVSPDGRQMSFVDQMTGNLALHDLTTGINRPLTHKTGWNESNEQAEESTFSPDGKRVAYAWFNKEGLYDLRIASLDSTGSAAARILYANEDVTWIAPEDWSRDGKWIAVRLERKDHTTQLGLISAADGSLRVLKSVGWGTSSRMYFSPDSRYLAMSLPNHEGSPQGDVFVMAIDGSREIPVVVHPADDQAVGWTPDGQHLLFSSDRTGPIGIYAIAFEDGKPRGNPRQLHSDIGRGRTIGLTRSGLLYFALMPGSRDLSIATVDFQSGRLIKPAAPAVHQFLGTNYQPDWSPDGRYLSYASYGVREKVVVKIHDSKTGDTRELAPPLRYFNFARWSPDGRSFVAQGTDLKGQQGVFRFDAQTAETEALALSAPGGQLDIPQWSPDEKRIYFIKRPDRSGMKGSLVERDVATGKERELLPQTTLDWFSPAPDGNHLVYDATDPVTKESVVSILPIAGGGSRDLLRPSAGFSHPYWTPDGRLILLRKAGELWAVDPAGSEPRKIDLGVNRILDFRVHPDGNQIAFMTRNDTPQEVWVMENLLPALTASK